MKKNYYQKPTMKVVQLRYMGMLMTSTPQGRSSVQDYTWQDIDEE